uniref:30S ribosomal protein S9 n=2 Tax=Lygus hesperus TaxID=30085 RepID=A0A0A9XEJ0_LYGHE
MREDIFWTVCLLLVGFAECQRYGYPEQWDMLTTQPNPGYYPNRVSYPYSWNQEMVHNVFGGYPMAPNPYYNTFRKRKSSPPLLILKEPYYPDREPIEQRWVPIQPHDPMKNPFLTGALSGPSYSVFRSGRSGARALEKKDDKKISKPCKFCHRLMSSRKIKRIQKNLQQSNDISNTLSSSPIEQ